jgi:hypothetical protein
MMGCIAFVYATMAGLLIQFFILPVVFPSFHAGHGLLTNDAFEFYRAGVDLAGRIKKEGWGVWELRPGGQAPAGIMAAAYVWLPSEPWAILPLYAGVFAISVAVLFAMLRLAGFSPRAAGVGVTPLLLLPSASLLFAIPHKDAFSVCGNLLFLYSLLRLVTLPVTDTSRELWGKLAGSLAFGLIGGFLVWVVRPYGVEVMQGAGAVVAVGMTVALFSRMVRRALAPGHGVAVLLAMWLLILLVGSSVSNIAGWREMTNAIEPVFQDEHVITGQEEHVITGQDGHVIKGQVVEEKVVDKQIKIAPASAKTQPVSGNEEGGTSFPFFEAAKKKIDTLAGIRRRYLAAHAFAASAVDVSVNFDNLQEMVVYLPRALQLGLFAPFPKDWLGEGSLAANTFMRRVAAFEMLLWYGVCLAMFFALIKGPNLLVRRLVVVYALLSLLVFVYAIPNLGTLYRMRFGFWVLLFSLGVAMTTTLFEARSAPETGTAGRADDESCAV